MAGQPNSEAIPNIRSPGAVSARRSTRGSTSPPTLAVSSTRCVGSGRGEGRFEPISWDDAIAEMAERFGAIIEASGGEAIWPFPGTGNVGWIHGSAGPPFVAAPGRQQSSDLDLLDQRPCGPRLHHGNGSGA
ncbi:MAG: hypothetical protein R2710_10785 [Acidimicrobiales bacterium]